MNINIPNLYDFFISKTTKLVHPDYYLSKIDGLSFH